MSVATSFHVREWLMEQWRELQNDASAPAIAYFRGAVEALAAADVLMKESAELWLRRADTCPDAGKEHDGGRQWCAYCGDLDSGLEGG